MSREGVGEILPFFWLCARQGAPSWECDMTELVEIKSSTGLTGRTVSRTARMSTARWNRKEAGGKTLDRRTETIYKADMKATIFKVRYLYGSHGRRCGGYNLADGQSGRGRKHQDG